MIREEYLKLLKEKTVILTKLADEFHRYINDHKSINDFEKVNDLAKKVDDAEKEWLELARNPRWDK